MRTLKQMPEFEIVRAYILVQLYADAVVPSFGIETYEFHALYRMHGEAPMTQADLGRLLLRDPMNVSRLVRSLESRGLVKRTQSETDARARLVSLTGKGAALAEKIAETLGKSTPTRRWSDEDRETFMTLLRRASAAYREACIEAGVNPERAENPARTKNAEGARPNEQRRTDARVDRTQDKEPLSRRQKRTRR